METRIGGTWFLCAARDVSSTSDKSCAAHARLFQLKKSALEQIMSVLICHLAGWHVRILTAGAVVTHLFFLPAATDSRWGATGRGSLSVPMGSTWRWDQPTAASTFGESTPPKSRASSRNTRKCTLFFSQILSRLTSLSCAASSQHLSLQIDLFLEATFLDDQNTLLYTSSPKYQPDRVLWPSA